jgi:thiol-disulfide isomerase/thioredoxin
MYNNNNNNNFINFLIIIFWIFILYIFFNIFFGMESLDDIETNNLKNNSKTKIYNFNASWCGHCKHFKPIWNQFSSTLNNNDIEAIDVKCDDDKNKKICDNFNVPGYPYVVIVKDNVKTPYDGPRTIDGLRSALNLDSLKTNDAQDDQIPKLKKFNRDDFIKSFANKINNIIAQKEKIQLFNFNTEWCGHSRSFQPIWEKFVATLDPKIYYARDIKCDNDSNQSLCEKYKITGFPTVIMDDSEPITYEGPRTVNALRAFLKLPPIDEKKIINEKKIVNIDENGITVYNFNTKWCGYSVKFQPEWNKFYNSLRESDGIRAIDVKCDKPENEELCNKYDVPGYPHIVINNKGKIEPYEGPREANAIRKALNI